MIARERRLAEGEGVGKPAGVAVRAHTRVCVLFFLSLSSRLSVSVILFSVVCVRARADAFVCARGRVGARVPSCASLSGGVANRRCPQVKQRMLRERDRKMARKDKKRNKGQKTMKHKTMYSPYKTNLVAETERIDEKTSFKLKEEERRERSLARKKAKVGPLSLEPRAAGIMTSPADPVARLGACLGARTGARMAGVSAQHRTCPHCAIHAAPLSLSYWRPVSVLLL